MGEIIDGVPAGLGGDQERTTLSPRRIARHAEDPSDPGPADGVSAAVPDDAEDRTTLSSRRDPVEDRTTLSPRRSPVEDRTTLSPRRSPVPAPERDPGSDPDPADDRTTLSRRGAADDERTTLSPRRLPSTESENAEPEAPVDDTVFTARPVEPAIVRGRLDTARAAAVPGANRERYRPRDAAAPAPVRRTHVAPPVATTDAGTRRHRRRRALPIALIGIGSLLVAGGAVTAVTMLMTTTAGGS